MFTLENSSEFSMCTILYYYATGNMHNIKLLLTPVGVNLLYLSCFCLPEVCGSHLFS